MIVETQPESLSTPPAEQTSISPKEPRGYVVLAIGLPGSGKTYVVQATRGVTPCLSSDLLRSLLFDDITEQRYQGLVFSTLRSLLRARLIAKMPWNYVDATNLSPHERKQWIRMAKSFGYEVHAVFFDVPLSVPCLERNSKTRSPGHRRSDAQNGRTPAARQPSKGRLREDHSCPRQRPSPACPTGNDDRRRISRRVGDRARDHRVDPPRKPQRDRAALPIEGIAASAG